MWVKLNSASASAFAYLVRAGFKFGIGNHLALLLNLDYLGSNPEFINVRTSTSLGTYTESSYSQRFGTVNVVVGIGYRW